MSGKRFLVVDDNPVLRGFLQTYLERKGHAVETVENGREALTRLDQAVYDAVLLDYMMPEVNGLEVLRHVRQHHPSLPVMMASERCSHVAATSFVALGARGCLFKPFDPQDLEQIMKCL
jgi:two-component system OmpR family response regulator